MYSSADINLTSKVSIEIKFELFDSCFLMHLNLNFLEDSPKTKGNIVFSKATEFDRLPIMHVVEFLHH